jgi:hypothetical protein
MRKFGFVVMALLVTAAASLAGPSPAKADDYPWCTQGRSLGYPGDCSYRTYEQCMASASGRALFCGPNPRMAFGQMPPSRRAYRDPYRQW